MSEDMFRRESHTRALRCCRSKSLLSSVWHRRERVGQTEENGEAKQ
jgi:hypothetical protein